MSFVGSHYLAKMAQEDPKDEDNEDAEIHRKKINPQLLKKLHETYYDIESPASLSSWQKLKKEVSKTIKSVKNEDVLEFLYGQPIAQIFRARKK